jgi:hypothetical protein
MSHYQVIKTPEDLLWFEVLNKQIDEHLRRVLGIVSSFKQNSPSLIEYNRKKRLWMQFLIDESRKTRRSFHGKIKNQLVRKQFWII